MAYGGKFHAKKGASWHSQRTIVPPEERTSPDGITHRTRAECRRWMKLQLLEREGVIRNLYREVKLPLQSPDAAIVVRGIESGRILSYTPDFIYERKVESELFLGMPMDLPQWTRIYEDIKGFMTDTQKLRIAVFEALYGVKVFVNKV